MRFKNIAAAVATAGISLALVLQGCQDAGQASQDGSSVAASKGTDSATTTQAQAPTAAPTAASTAAANAKGGANLTIQPPAKPTSVVDSSSIKDKVIVGYQGWFNAKGDGSPANRWVHWSNGGTAPGPGNVKFELYPNIRDYPETSLFQTGFANLGNGKPAKLFSSYDPNVIYLHFQWMMDYGIDGAALQRFGTSLDSASNKAHRDSVAEKVKQAAEAYGRIFYIMYDISGMSGDQLVGKIENDWTNTMIGKLAITSSPQYAKQNGKPVVCIWGFGFATRDNTPDQAKQLIQWFKDQGYYVIGGVPNKWRTGTNDSKPGFEEAYRMFNMVSPWTVSAYSTDADVDKYVKNTLLPDKEYLEQYGVDFQPVINPGFAWSNMKEGFPQNSRPRRQGGLFWKQAYEVTKAHIPGAYIAMFDEYDEGTAIAKGAEDSSMVPTDQYFLTLSADGKYISSDFYLRLAGSATKMIEGKAELVPQVPVPYSLGPVFFRTSFEPTDAALTWTDTVDTEHGGALNVAGYGGAGDGPTLAVVAGESSVTGGADAAKAPAHRGKFALQYAGQATEPSASHVYFKAFDVDIPVTQDMKLSYWMYPENELARHASIDLVLSDGTTLRESPAVDAQGQRIQPTQPIGAVGSWTQITSSIGQALNGKTIQTILVGFDGSGAAGDFRGYIDDIVLTTGEIDY
ncbi:MAG: xylosidase/arabinosidase [Paenibacillaceae bacterium]|nr:xylosidase/arabinosidase [Paenibacillaceae bacterium]